MIHSSYNITLMLTVIVYNSADHHHYFAYVDIHTLICVYIYIYREREKEREREGDVCCIHIHDIYIYMIYIYIYIYISPHARDALTSSAPHPKTLACPFQRPSGYDILE